MNHISPYNIFENKDKVPTLIDVHSMDEFIESFNKEFCSKDFNFKKSPKYECWIEFFKDGTFDESKYLLLDALIKV